jgi:glycine cleavage system H protein
VKTEELKYTKTHEWVHVDSKTSPMVITVGITSFALQALTDLVFIELPPVGRRLEAQKPFGEVESVKAVSDLYSPVDGEVVEVNPEWSNADNLAKLHDDPYTAGWLLRIRVQDEHPLSQLMDYATYQKQCEE